MIRLGNAVSAGGAEGGRRVHDTKNNKSVTKNTYFRVPGRQGESRRGASGMKPGTDLHSSSSCMRHYVSAIPFLLSFSLL